MAACRVTGCGQPILWPSHRRAVSGSALRAVVGASVAPSTPPRVYRREVGLPHHPDVLPVDVHPAFSVDLELVRPPGADAAPRLDRPRARAHRRAADRSAGLPGHDAARRDLLLRLLLPLLRGGVPHQTLG